MCGRYVLRQDPTALAAQMGIRQPTLGERLAAYEPNYNVAPTDEVVAVLERPERGAAGAQAGAVRDLHAVRWGLIPSWTTVPVGAQGGVRSVGAKMINARIETAAEKPSFRTAFRKRRCILPADGYYEWYRPMTHKQQKQPYFIHDPSGRALAFAGMYELWRDPAVEDRDDPVAWLWTATILTTTSVGSLSRIHDRMPVLVPRANFDMWLDPDFGSGPGDVEALRGMLDSDRDPELAAYAVSTAVNSVRNDGPALIEAVAVEP